MIQPICQSELQEAIDLVNRVFTKFVAVDYSEKGQKTFSDYIQHKYEDLSTDISNGEKEMWGYFVENKLVGVLAMQENSHISLLFVDWQYHRRGIARQLFAYIRNRALNAGCTEITVHSSPYAVPVYQRFGFIKTGPEQELNGIRYIPMKHIL